MKIRPFDVARVLLPYPYHQRCSYASEQGLKMPKKGQDTPQKSGGWYQSKRKMNGAFTENQVDKKPIIKSVITT